MLFGHFRVNDGFLHIFHSLSFLSGDLVDQGDFRTGKLKHIGSFLDRGGDIGKQGCHTTVIICCCNHTLVVD